MSYIALYRQYRPQTFQEIKGQEPISKTLKNALASGRLSHAYLFCGPRGTGKTSTAKVLAKAVNCQDRHEGEPCNECPSCQQITEGTSMDVLEIDAASNRGIDEIRDLREKVKLSPVESRYKVYIIDEVHMLTSEAFNALLKTLEEPPGHVIFILATTDPRKIPATILSRCQRFDFRQIALEVIVARLREVAEAAGVVVEEEAFYLMARQAQGGLRDALGLLDQCLASGNKEVSLQEVATLLGAVEDELLLKFHQTAFAGDIGGCLLLLDKLLGEGRELKQFVGDLTLFYRNLLLLRLGGKAKEIVAIAPEIQGHLQEAAEQVSQAQYLSILRILNQTESELKWSSQARILLELGIISLVDELQGKGTQVAVIPEELGPSIEVKPQVVKTIPGEEEQTRKQTMVAARTDETGRATVARPMGSGRAPGPTKPGKPQLIISSDQGSSSDISIDFRSIQTRWNDFLETLRKKAHPSYEAFLRVAELKSLEGGTLICEFPSDHTFHKERMEEPQIRQKVEQVLEEYYGGSLGLKCRLKNDHRVNQRQSEENEIIKSAIEIFGGELVDIIDE